MKNINDTTDSTVRISETTDKTLTFITKFTGTSTGATGIGKGSVEMLEAIACQDGVCAVVSGIGVCADVISISTSFIPGPNVTVLVTAPVSIGCKVFVHCCKRAKRIPWGC